MPNIALVILIPAQMFSSYFESLFLLEKITKIIWSLPLPIFWIIIVVWKEVSLLAFFDDCLLTVFLSLEV